jgi:hypothetical protein
MQSVDDYTSFLSRHGVPAEGRWARQELIAGNDTRNLHAFLDCAGYLRLWTIAGLWLGSLFLTALVTLSLLVALAAALLRRSALGAPEGPAEPGTFWGALIGLLSTMVIYARISLLGFLTYDMQTVAIMLSATVIVIACAAAIARSLRAQWRDANINGKFIDIRAAIATLGFMLIFAGVLSLTLTPVRGFLYTGNSLIGAESSNPDANAVFAHLPEFILFDLFLIAAFDAIRFWRKDPIGFLGRCARRACGLAAFLLIANCACIAITARYERQGSEMLVRMITNEYVLNTQLMGKTLPPYIPPPPMP